MTEKLYYKDAYISKFNATVVSFFAEGERLFAVLDKTAFFPEEGGQSADKGMIEGARVLDVIEREGVVYHIVDSPLTVGETVECAVDFVERYEKMKSHTAEHILCGIMHRLFGAENIGFHLGDDVVTFDVSPVLTREDLDRVEDIANRIVAENVDVIAFFPTNEELSSLEYRAKLDLTENVRIVSIGDYDKCACCAPHVSKTGEIGLIKMLDFSKHRGGTRIYMVAGERALSDYRKRYAITQKISAMTSTPQMEIAEAVKALQSEKEALKSVIKERGLLIARMSAEAIPETHANVVRYFASLDVEEVREFVNLAVRRVEGMVVALTGEEGNYKFIIGSKSLDLRQMAKEMTESLGGRGGGRPEMIQGTFLASLADIENYFLK